MRNYSTQAELWKLIDSYQINIYITQLEIFTRLIFINILNWYIDVAIIRVGLEIDF